MAATDSKPSPTSQPVQQKESSASADGVMPGKETQLKEPPTVAAEATSAVDPITPLQKNKDNSTKHVADQQKKIPSYETSESSEHYVTAKEFLSSGDFEQALMKIEEGIELTKALLESVAIDPNAVLELHESLAPFHYLYGTTLLYSIEESTDTQQMTIGQETATPNHSSNTATSPEPGASNALAAVATALATNATNAAPSDESTPNDASAPGYSENNSGADAGVTDNADDMEIAWENLEAARAIVELMLADDKSLKVEEKKEKLKLDLAQILLREGDLQRMNGRYLDAIKDYHSCLEVGESIMQKQNRYNRKIADVQYNLGLSYLTSSSELKKQTNDADGEAGGPPTNVGSMDQATRDKLSEEHRVKGVYHYLECSKVLCGSIAILCGADPQQIIDGTSNSGTAEAKPTAGFKTTGLEDDDATASKPSEATLVLCGMRQRAAGLKPSMAGDDTVSDLRQFLDEIQETVDEAESAQEAVRQASEMKVQAQKAAQQGDSAELASETTTTASGITTTIGFGKPSASVLKATETKDAPSRPMMVVKKKKKKREPQDDDANEAKRTRTE